MEGKDNIKTVDFEKLADKREHKCEFCIKTFSLKHNLKRHIRQVHQPHETITKIKYCCNTCSKNFNKKFNLQRHILRSCNTITKVRRSQTKVVQCAMCDFKETKSIVLKHYRKEHDVNIEFSALNFLNTSKFDEWKNKIEKETVSKFIKFDSTKTHKATISYYRCHRDGNFESEGKGIRQIKLLGSNKIGAYCPAKIDAKILQNGEVVVKYLSIHVGHTGELRRIPLSKSDRLNIAEKISNKIPFDEIIKSVHDNIAEDSLDRIHLLRRKDVINIEQLFNLSKDSVRRAKVNTRVEPRVKQIQKSGGDSITRLYKDQGEISEQFEVETFKTKIKQDLTAMLSGITSIKQCKVLHVALLSVRPTLTAMKSSNKHSFPEASNITVGINKKMDPQRSAHPSEESGKKTNT